MVVVVVVDLQVATLILYCFYAVGQPSGNASFVDLPL